jgi:hypothetical protein
MVAKSEQLLFKSFGAAMSKMLNMKLAGDRDQDEQEVEVVET